MRSTPTMRHGLHLQGQQCNERLHCHGGGGRQPVSQFTQADLAGGKVVFTHNGAAGRSAGFNVVVSDHTGATSGEPQAVEVIVRG